MPREIKDLFNTSWEKELQDGDTAIKKDSGEELKVVFLAALQRLARSAGIVHQHLEIITPSDTMVQAIFYATFKTEDGIVEFVGSADCNGRNTNGKFLQYPTAVAESRAEARCLRKALGIRLLSSEEVGLRENFGSLEASPVGKADSQLIVAIENLCQNRGIQPVRVLEAAIENKERASTIFELTELTVEEAQRALAWLNEQKPAAKKAPTATEERAARKKELLEKEKQ